MLLTQNDWLLIFKTQEAASYYNRLKPKNAIGLAKGAGFSLNI